MDTLEFTPNFNGSEYEPSIFPAKVPILLLNGRAGIAMGMAMNIPPHNLIELMDVCVAITERKNEDGEVVTNAMLMRINPAPDFPTEATIIGKSGSRKFYTTGMIVYQLAMMTGPRGGRAVCNNSIEVRIN